MPPVRFSVHTHMSCQLATAALRCPGKTGEYVPPIVDEGDEARTMPGIDRQLSQAPASRRKDRVGHRGDDTDHGYPELALQLYVYTPTLCIVHM
jgi:hypothetical protein